MRCVLVLLLALVVRGACGADETIRISFEEPVRVARGAYGRVHAIGRGRYALVYEAGGVQFRTSSDGCRTWSEPVRAVPIRTFGEGDRRVEVYPANPEVQALAGGRLLVAYNGRPSRGRADLHPYEIGVVTSDDGGRTWSDPQVVYAATNVADGVMRGCYEPNLLARDGRLRLFFADESPYVDGRHKFQNISVVETRDRGRTWSAAKPFCYTPRARDGMPVAARIGAHTYVAIEANGDGTLLHPEIVRDDGVRMEPLLAPKNWREVYAGAPYLAATANFILLSYQSSEGSAARNERYSSCEVVAMPRQEMRKGRLDRFRGAARPIAVDQTRDAALWNALCPLDGDTFLVVSQHRGEIVLTRGRVTQAKTGR